MTQSIPPRSHLVFILLTTFFFFIYIEETIKLSSGTFFIDISMIALGFYKGELIKGADS